MAIDDACHDRERRRPEGVEEHGIARELRCPMRHEPFLQSPQARPGLASFGAGWRAVAVKSEDWTAMIRVPEQ
jgi:hypothetical protein